jgi:hypothetical protein
VQVGDLKDHAGAEPPVGADAVDGAEPQGGAEPPGGADAVDGAEPQGGAEPPGGADAVDGAEPLDVGASRRRLVDIRCGFAELARREAGAAEERVVEARRLFDAQLAVLTAAQAEVDPGATRGAKEEAHRAFRKAIGVARSRSQVEVAAGVWLTEINRINGAVRASQLRIRREREETDAAAAELDRQTAIAEASRAMAEAAVEACRAAQEALAVTDGEEVARTAGDPTSGSAAELIAAHAASQAGLQAAATLAAAASPGAAPDPNSEAAEGAQPADPSQDAATVMTSASTGGSVDAAALAEEAVAPIDLRGPAPLAIVRLLERDGAAMSRLVDWLSGPNAEQRRRWQLCLSNLVDAVVATAIDGGWFVFEAGNPFWDQLTQVEARDVARGLAALGFRYDGMGEFADGRVPSHRELSMALGNAGLLPVRVRHWPRPEETALLYRQVSVDPIALLAEQAPSLTMGELVLMLGRRAEMAADLWNDWSRARPLLLLPVEPSRGG